MKTAILGFALAAVLASGVVDAQSTFRGDAAHAGSYRDDGPRQFHRVKCGNADCSSQRVGRPSRLALLR
jgi:hypothetical protein